MSGTAHSYAFLRGLPLVCGDLRPSGAAALTACLLQDTVNEKNRTRINDEAEDEQSRLVGEFFDDTEMEIEVKLLVPTGFAVPAQHSTLTIATGGVLTNRYAGNYRISEVGLAWSSKKGMIVSLTLRKSQYLTYTVAAAP